MSDLEMKKCTTEIPTGVNPETVESPDRRSFIKGTVMVAGAVAASSLSAAPASAASPQREEPLQGPPAAFARQPVAVLQLNFDRRKPPSVQDIQEILPKIFRLTGCVACGLIGLDLRIGINDVLPAIEENINLSLEGTLAGQR
ncbi:MAG: hypothetical protein HY314_04230 [Acidobacteria bacterium]|nr:hypothetical protein [Acidobacteriota bacterium]